MFTTNAIDTRRGRITPAEIERGIRRGRKLRGRAMRRMLAAVLPLGARSS